MSRYWAMPDKFTFRIAPIADLLKRYNVGIGWIDPFAGDYSPAEITNDLNPKRRAKFHLEAAEFAEMLDEKYEGCLFDPPYSLNQIFASYKGFGKEEMIREDPAGVYGRTKTLIAEKIRLRGYTIHFGWHSNGFGRGRGFVIREILLVAHGRAHNDTIVTVEQKIDGQTNFDFTTAQ